MEHIDEQRLNEDLEYRFDYLKKFIGFNEDDATAIRSVIGYLGPRIPELVDATYQHLLSFDATARHFVPKQHGLAGSPPVSLESLSIDHDQIKFRKDHLQRYLMHLLGHAFNEKMAVYLDMAGKIHTDHAGNDQINVPLIQMNALMGLLSDLLTHTLLSSDLPAPQKNSAIRAFLKLFWIQNDFISKHYVEQVSD